MADKKPTKASTDLLFKGKGVAILNVYGHEHWKTFLKHEDKEIPYELTSNIDYAADYNNFNVHGEILVEWPNVTVVFNMDKFLGKTGAEDKEPLILSATQNFFTVIHPFSVDKEWCKGMNNRDTKKFNGYEWAFEQDTSTFKYEGHIRRGKEHFITFSFLPDRSYHFFGYK